MARVHILACFILAVFGSDCSVAQTQFTIATVKTNLATGFWDKLVKEFEHDGKCNLDYTSEQQHLYDVARDPKKHVDLVFTHTRHEGFWSFVKSSYSEDPNFIMSNSTAFLIPSDDPAGIGGISDRDPFKMMAAIAKSGACFVVNGDVNTKYVATTLSEGLEKGEWYIDNGLKKDDAAHYASQHHCYMLWGNTAFDTFDRKNPGNGLGLVDANGANGNIMRRQMVATVVSPKAFEDAAQREPAHQCALDFVKFLLEPATQREITGDGFEGSARNNSDDVLCAVLGKSCSKSPEDDP